MRYKFAGLGVAAGLVGLLLPTGLWARTWHVRSDGAGDAPTVQAGIDSALAGDDVLVAPGIYTWTSEGASGTTLLRLKASVLLQSEGGSGSTILDAESRGRVASADVGGRMTIRGFTLQGGLIEVNQDLAGGAAVRAINGAVLEMSECRLQGNEAISRMARTHARGGAVYCEDGTFDHCEFLNNKVSMEGYAGAAQGGGIFARFASVSGCTFRSNRAECGMEIARGGAIQADSLTLVDCHLEGNVAYSFGYNAVGGAVYSQGPVVVTRCHLSGNSTQALWGDWSRGGALAVGTGGLSVEDCNFMDNAASGDGDQLCSGGAVYSEGAATIRGSVFAKNWANQGGGMSYGWGGAACCGEGSLMERCTLIGNWAGGADLPGGGGHVPGTGGIVIGGTVRQCIVMSTRGETAKGGTWSCCDCFANEFADPVPGVGNFSADPRFCAVDPSATGNYTLRSDSPCAPGEHPPGSESCDLIGAAPVGCAQTAIKPSTAGQVKSLYR